MLQYLITMMKRISIFSDLTDKLYYANIAKYDFKKLY